MRTDTRGSCSRCVGFARPRAVLNETLPSSTSTQTTVECGEPSSRKVVAIPTKGFSARNCRCFSFSAAIHTSCSLHSKRREAIASSPMGVLLPVGTRKGLFLLRSDDDRRSWEVEGPLLPGWSVFHATVDPRDGVLYAATNNFVYGATVHRSDDVGSKWEVNRGLLAHPTRETCQPGASGMCTHSIQLTDSAMYVAISAAGSFRSEDG